MSEKNDPINAMFWIVIIVVMIADINDLIRGSWFFKGLYPLILWNLMAITAYVYLISEYLK